MNVFESRTLFAWLSCLLALQSAQAQPPATGPGVVPDPTVNAPMINDAPGQAVAGNYFGYTEVDSTFDPLLRVDTRGGRLMGQDGFTRISAFMPYWLEDDALLYADAGAMLLYNPSGGANLNLGWRYYVDELDRVFGLYAGYDYDPGHNREYHQFAFGFESLGRYVDYRATGYVPFSNKTSVLSSDLSGPVAFLQNNIILGRVRGIESATTGFDMEVGGPIPILGRYGVSTYLGIYYFDGSDTGNITGFSSRTQGQVNEDLTVGVQVSHDSVFQTDVQMQVTWTLPDGGPGRWLRQPRVRDRLLAPVVRNQRVIVRNDTVISGELAINPLDNLPFFVAHINPNRPPGTGTGTFEDPFSQLLQFDTMPGKPNVDIAYVTARGDGTSTQLDTGVTLLNNQRLLSTAVPHTFTAVQGTFDLPGFIGGPLPVLANNGGGNVVTFATGHRNIEVSGFTINGSATGNGIAGINNQRININRNVLQNGLNGVRLTNLSGGGAANRSLIDDNDFLNNIGVGLNGDGFSVINNAAAPLEIFITNNTAIGNNGNGFRLQADNGSAIGGRFTGNSTANTGIGTSNSNNGLALFTNGGDIDFFNALNDWRIGGTGANDTNSFSDNGNFGISVIATGGGDTSLRIIDNDVSRNSLNGFAIAADSGTHVLQIGGNDPTLGNRFENNGLNGNLLNLTGTSSTSFNIQNNLFRQNGNNGNGGGPIVVPGSFFDIDVVFLGGLTASQQAVFALAAARWEEIIIGDLPDVGPIDDIEITAEGLLLDGPGGFAGFGGPTALRPASSLPFTGQMQFDSADLPDAEALGFLDDLILHEMGHALGFGTIWTNLGLLQNAGSTANNPGPQFIGAAALAEHLARFGGTDTGVPVDNSGVAGTQDAHWRENPYDPELMTGGLALGVNPISRVTIAQFQDLGYTVNLAQADPFVTVPYQQRATIEQALAAGASVVAPTASAPVITPVGLAVVGTAIGDGINISVTDAATITASTILDNVITENARHGIYVTTNAGVSIPNLQVHRNEITENGLNGVGSGIFLDRFDSSTINMTASNNVVTGNLGDGLTVNSQGIAFGGVTVNSLDNTYDDNEGNGANLQTAGTADIVFTSNRDTFSGNTLNGINALSEDGTVISMLLHNIIANDNTLDGLNLHSTDTSIMQVLVDSPVDPLFAGTGSVISGNDEHGVAAFSEVSSRFILNMDDVVLDNAQDGININRADTSLMQVTLTDVVATGNGDDGLEFFFAGARHTDAAQPLSGTPNSLNVTDSQFNSNGGNGMHIEGHADGVLLANVVTSTFNSNAGDGVFVETSEDASFGIDAANRSIFSGITATGNVDNGMQFDVGTSAPFGSFQFVTIDADAGNTLISGNSGNGIEINAFGNTEDFIIEGTPGNAFTTQILGNEGDGVEINIGSGNNTTVVIRDVIIGGASPAQGNGGDGIDVNNNGNGALITIGDAAGDATIIQNSGGDGISFAQSGSADDIAGVIENTQILDSDGHGLSVIGDGPLDEDFTSSSYFITMTGSQVRRSGLNGVNVQLNGHMLGNFFAFDSNVIANNGSQGTDQFTSNGVFFQLNAQDTLKSNANSTLFRDATIPPNSAFPVNPNNPALTGLSDYDSPYLNLTTALQSELVFTRNTVNFNGNNAIGAGDGLYLRVSTNSYLAADVGGATGSGLGNSFSGNTLADFRTGSFLATERATGNAFQPPNGVAGADPLVNPSTIFLDDTAQLDLRFKNNTGTDLNPSLNEQAVYTNADPAKNNDTFRLAQYFQVDGPPADIDNTNVFTLPGFPGLTESDLFFFGDYNVRNVADPLFPNPAFPPFLP